MSGFVRHFVRLSIAVVGFLKTQIRLVVVSEIFEQGDFYAIEEYDFVVDKTNHKEMHRGEKILNKTRDSDNMRGVVSTLLLICFQLALLEEISEAENKDLVPHWQNLECEVFLISLFLFFIIKWLQLNSFHFYSPIYSRQYSSITAPYFRFND